MIKTTKTLNFIIFIFILFLNNNATASFQLYTQHPHAQQLGAVHRQSGYIEDLVLYNNKIFAGYGTHNNHNFPLQICGFKPPSKTFICETTISSEGAGHFRLLDDKLYVAGIDPRPSSWDFYVRKSNETWLNQPSFTDNVAHIYDIESSGGNLWVTLSKFDDDSRVMKGRDNGTWTESLFVTPESGHTSSNYSVLYFIVDYKGTLYTQAYDTQDGIRSYSYTSKNNGNTWVKGPSLLLHVPPSPNSSSGLQNFRHEELNGKLVMKQSSFLISFDGLNAQTLRSGVRNIAKTDRFIYILQSNGDIYRTDDLNYWYFVASAPTNSTSIEIQNNDIYVGTEGGTILKYENALVSTDDKGVAIQTIVNILLLNNNKEKSTFESSNDGWKIPSCVGYEQVRLNSGTGTPGSLLVRESLNTSIQPNASCNPLETRGLEVAHYKDFPNANDVFQVSGRVRAKSDYSGASSVTNWCVTAVDASSKRILNRNCTKYTNQSNPGWTEFNYDFTPYVKGVDTVRILIGTWDSWAKNWQQKIFIDDIVVEY